MSASSFWVFLCAGLLVGWFRLLPRRFRETLDTISLIALVLLLSGMGAQIGANPKVIPLVGSMGLQAALISVFAMMGSVLMVLPLERLLFSTAERAEAAVRDEEGQGRVGGENYDERTEDEHAPGPGHYVEEAQPLQGRTGTGQADRGGRPGERGLVSRLVKVVLGSVVAGIAIGYAVLPASALVSLDRLTSISLAALVITIGVDLGQNRHTWVWLRSAGVRVVVLPLLVAAGTLAGSLAAGLLAGIPTNESLAVGAGFGWYSLSGALLSKIYRADTGALAFLANVARELGSVVLMPFLARWGLRATVVAPGGATTMDTTLPLILRLTDRETAVLALANGIVLTILVPLLVPILINLR